MVVVVLLLPGLLESLAEQQGVHFQKDLLLDGASPTHPLGWRDLQTPYPRMDLLLVLLQVVWVILREVGIVRLVLMVAQRNRRVAHNVGRVVVGWGVGSLGVQCHRSLHCLPVYCVLGGWVGGWGVTGCVFGCVCYRVCVCVWGKRDFGATHSDDDGVYVRCKTWCTHGDHVKHNIHNIPYCNGTQWTLHILLFLSLDKTNAKCLFTQFPPTALLVLFAFGRGGIFWSSFTC